MEQAQFFSEIVADAIIKKTAPVKDDLSERQAREAYGSRWLSRVSKSGLAECHRIGGKVVYSRHQLDCIRLAERQQASILFNN